jgi:hypothetical protein
VYKVSCGRYQVGSDEGLGTRRQDHVVQLVAVVGELGHQVAAVDPLNEE